MFGRIAGGGAFNRGKNFFQLGVELFVLMGFGGNIAKKLAGGYLKRVYLLWSVLQEVVPKKAILVYLWHTHNLR